jgi:hypothetical protein
MAGINKYVSARMLGERMVETSRKLREEEI